MKKLKVVVPKGRIQDGVVRLMAEAGFGMEIDRRVYTPRTDDPDLEVKIMKPQNIPQLVELGSHDAGFTGHDWLVETGADVVEILDLGLDPVKIVAAMPEKMCGKTPEKDKLVVASEYRGISEKYLAGKGYGYVLLRTYGATEVFPPDDADMIVDNISTGRTLKEHGLAIVDTILESSTRFIANKEAMQDAAKAEKIGTMKMLFQSVLDARQRVMLEMNIPEDKLEALVAMLPCMKSPTVAPLYGQKGFAVKAAVKRIEVAGLIPRLKKLGASDILEYSFRKVVI
ncbi:MAG: ATP phosphoribosyltransferase [Pseudomonadota bacterium]